MVQAKLFPSDARRRGVHTVCDERSLRRALFLSDVGRELRAVMDSAV